MQARRFCLTDLQCVRKQQSHNSLGDCLHEVRVHGFVRCSHACRRCYIDETTSDEKDIKKHQSKESILSGNEWILNNLPLNSLQTKRCLPAERSGICYLPFAWLPSRQLAVAACSYRPLAVVVTLSPYTLSCSTYICTVLLKRVRGSLWKCIAVLLFSS